MENDAGYRRLIAWKKSDDLALLIYKITQQFPQSELYGITSQIRRAAISVPTNIVEGYARNGKTEFKHFITIALGSLAEVKYLLSVAFRLKYLKEKDYTDALGLAESSGQLLWKLCKSL